MLQGLFDSGRTGSAILLLGGGVGLLAATMSIASSLVGERESSPSRRALAHAIPIAILALCAAILGHPEIAIGVIFGTSIAMLSAVVAFVTLSGPVHDLPDRAARVWAFLPIPALLVLLLGFQGILKPFDAFLLLALGGILMTVWHEPAHPEPADLFAATAGRSKRRSLTIVEVIGAAILAALSSWAATRGATCLAGHDISYPTLVTAATLLSVVLAMPMISSGVPLALAGEAWAPITAQVGVVFINLGLLLPVVILVTGLGGGAPGPAATQPAELTGLAAMWRPVLYPRLAWRIDSVALVILSLLFAAVAQRKIAFDRRTAPWLIVGYCIYMLSVMILGSRMV